ncbi:hypothetical protein MYX84_05800 [Acidobacteria bacterium AH-259-O06]|nr:hypothetical protein [Acidobacteria bacterium AH-259-O06]
MVGVSRCSQPCWPVFFEFFGREWKRAFLLNPRYFKVRDASKIRGPIHVTYRFQTPSGERTHEKVLQPSDFRNNEAIYSFNTAELTPCKSLSIAYY